MFLALLFDPSNWIIISRIIFHLRTQRVYDSDHTLTQWGA